MTLAAFLLARIAEDVAELGVLVGRDEGAGPNGLGWAEVGAISEVLMISHARALAECEAKRQIVEMHSNSTYGDRSWDGACDRPDPDGCPTLIELTAVYADHPDYRQAWPSAP